MLVGVNGPAGSGKDTVAGYMQKYAFGQIAFADPLKRICRDVYAFSEEQLWGPSEMRNAPDLRYPREHGPWVDGQCVCCGHMPRGVVVGSVASKTEVVPGCHLTPRYALQRLGTEWARDCYKDTWAAMGIRTAATLLRGGFLYGPARGLLECPAPSSYRGVVISDVRFRNEMEHIKRGVGDNHACLLLRVKRPGSAGITYSSHASESEQLSLPDSYFDAVLVNDGTLAELYAKVDQFMEARGCRM